MSAGLSIAGEVFWGSNGAVEAYVEALAAEAGARFGPDAPLAAFFRQEREGFFMGKVVFLDHLLEEDAPRQQFLDSFGAATAQLLREGGFSAYGREWAASLGAWLRVKLAA